MTRTSDRVEWLNLIERSGPFVEPPVLEEVFPQGLETVETPRRQRLRAAYEEWCDAVEENDVELPELHQAWTHMVLEEALEYEQEVLVSGEELGDNATFNAAEHGGKTSADIAVRANGKPRMYVGVYPPGTVLDKPLPKERWVASPAERMTHLCRSKDVRCGVVPNGEQWMLVNAPIGGTSGFASWFSRLWWLEPSTLKAFQSLLGVRRCFGPPEDTLEGMLERSVEFQEEVTDTLGDQVRRAVEVLVQALGKADQDLNGELLKDVGPAELYEAGLTVMMRLVFVLCAEERGLLLLGDPMYDQHYAISTLRAQLREEADRYGVEVLERRHDAWSRMLSVFRAVFGGIGHESLRMPALGGSLFDPDRFPFLEGREKGSSWRKEPAVPLPVDNRTALLLLSALQVLEQRGGAQLLSYRALDVEQIGHVYEGLLEYTVEKTSDVMVGLIGSQRVRNPTIVLKDLELLRENGDGDLVSRLVEATGRSNSAIERALEQANSSAFLGDVLQATNGDEPLAQRLLPFVALIRRDSWGSLVVYGADSFAVTPGTGRRDTGTHYTPKALTEEIVQTTLDPLVYDGPSEGELREKWCLRSSSDILALKICDPAMGSGAFLVQACRFLSARLVEAWQVEEDGGKVIDIDGTVRDNLDGFESLPSSKDDRLLTAQRLVSERCLYGVDKNPLAVELAKLSIWLVTLSKGRPFAFLDHSFRCGDSLLGIHSTEQLAELAMAPDIRKKQVRMFGRRIKTAIEESVELRIRLQTTPIRDIHDVELMSSLNDQSRHVLDDARRIADAFIGEVFRSDGNTRTLSASVQSLAIDADRCIDGDSSARESIVQMAKEGLSVDLAEGRSPRQPFHWPIEFPELFSGGRLGFSAIVGNPPFMGGLKLFPQFGRCYRSFLINHLANGVRGVRGAADLCAYFFLRAGSLLSDGGHVGLLATNTISQGDTREVGLSQLEESGFVTYHATSSRKWPGRANLEVAHMALCKGTWRGLFILDGKVVKGISSYLAPIGEVSGKPFKLAANKKIAFQGSNVCGMGFVLTVEEAKALLAKNSNNKDVLFPYLNGQDLNSRPDQSASRWVINFHDWPLCRTKTDTSWNDADSRQRKEWLQSGEVPEDYSEAVASDYPDCLRIIEERVKPDRLALEPINHFNRGLKRKWWQYGGPRRTLYETISAMDRVLIRARVANINSVAFVPTNIVASEATVVFAMRRFGEFALLQSCFHTEWLRHYASSMRTDVRYTPSVCFETFPFPDSFDSLDGIGEKYYRKREEFMHTRSVGLTRVHSMILSPIEDDSEVQELRRLNVEMDEAVADAYLWSDLALEHGEYEGRFGLSEQAGKSVLARLLRLNHQRHAQEELDKKAKKKGLQRASKRKEPESSQEELFG